MALLDPIKEAVAALVPQVNRAAALLELLASSAGDPADVEAVAAGLREATAALQAASDTHDGDPNTPPPAPTE